MRIHTIFSSLAVIVLASTFTHCSSNEIGNSKDVAQDKIYQQYTIRYNEGDSKYTAKAQFRFAGRNGTTLVLNKPAYLQYDMMRIEVDSTKYSGAFYEFSGDAGLLFASHHFVYTDVNNKSYENGFFMNAFKIINTPVTASKKLPLTISYGFDPSYSLQGDDYIELSATNTDSSFHLTVDKMDPEGKITIGTEQLKRQKTKELNLEIALYRRFSLKEATAEGGSMEIEYRLKPITIKLAD
jgi:hypothetical protein